MKTTTALAIAIIFLPGCSRKPDPSAVSGKLSGQNLLLITLDTTRADRLGCYGYKQAATPALDALAARGTLYENAYAQVPLTLPSHASILTGRYPREHGVRDNARNALGTGFPTLATLSKEHGYKTAAFVASFVLDSRFGLERGFDIYNDDMGEVNFDVQPLEWQQPANVMTDRALQWLESVKQSENPFFCWVHYYDPHQPYHPPEQFRRADVLPYDGEIAFMDTQIKRLSDWLSAAGLAERTLVIVIGDHGEAFGEHGEKGHSEHVYQVNVHIPLFFAHPAVVRRGQRVSAIVESIDVFPTVLELFGWKGPPKLMSRSLAPSLAGRPLPSVSAYSESLYLLNNLGWSEQRGLTADRWKYVSSVKPELYDRRLDPGETRNLIADEPRIAAGLLKELRDRYEAMPPGEAAVPEWDSAARSALETLGYLGGSAVTTEEFVSPGLPDPKDLRDVFLQFKAVNDYLEQNKQPEEIAKILPLAEHVVERSPNAHIFQRVLGLCYLRAKQPAAAIAPLEAAIRLDPRQTPALTLLGDAFADLKRFDEAIAHYRAALALEKNDVTTRDNVTTVVGLADVFYKAGKIDEAALHYQRALELFPAHALAQSRLGIVLTSQGKFAEANVHLQEAVRLVPQNPEFHYNFGLGLLYARQFPQATQQFQEAVRLKPNHGEALLKLGMVLFVQDAIPAAKDALTQAMAIPEFTADACYQLGVILDKERNYAESVNMYEKAVALKPDNAPSILDLSQFYLAQGNARDAVRILRIGATNVPDNVRILERLARVLAVSKVDALRDGAAAVTLAQRASNLSAGREPVVEATLAAAYAESGDFRRAIEFAQKALRLAEDTKKDDIVSIIQAQLEGYLNNRPFREPNF